MKFGEWMDPMFRKLMISTLVYSLMSLIFLIIVGLYSKNDAWIVGGIIGVTIIDFPIVVFEVSYRIRTVRGRRNES